MRNDTERRHHIDLAKKFVSGKFDDVVDELCECSNRQIYSPSTLTKAIYEIECLRERLKNLREAMTDALDKDDRYPND